MQFHCCNLHGGGILMKHAHESRTSPQSNFRDCEHLVNSLDTKALKPSRLCFVSKRQCTSAFSGSGAGLFAAREKRWGHDRVDVSFYGFFWDRFALLCGSLLSLISLTTQDNVFKSTNLPQARKRPDNENRNSFYYHLFFLHLRASTQVAPLRVGWVCLWLE